jgi:dienelactone hydrolase
MRILTLCILALGLFVARSAHAAPKMESATFQSARGTEIAGYYFRPRGDGPFPAVVGMHGCGGLFEKDRKTLSPNRMDWAQRFVEAGYVALFPDSFQPRGYLSVCEIKLNEQPVKMNDHVGDLAGAINWLAGQPFVDRDKIALIGWGTGGRVVLRILDPQLPLHKRVNLKAAIAFYPPCEGLTRVTEFTPRLAPTILIGAKDEWVRPAPCQALAARWGSPIVVYPGAHHNFDVPNVPVRTRNTGEGPKRAGTNAAARAKAINEVKGLLVKAFEGIPTGAGSGK